MSGKDDGAEVFGAFIAFVVIAAAIATAVAAALSVGGLFGAGHAIVNYMRSFIANVKPEAYPRRTI